MLENSNEMNLMIILTLFFMTVFTQSTIYASGREATIVSHTIPATMQAGVTYPVTVTVRNDGTEAWSEQKVALLLFNELV
jgi:subtilase family serine protease